MALGKHTTCVCHLAALIFSKYLYIEIRYRDTLLSVKKITDKTQLEGTIKAVNNI